MTKGGFGGQVALGSAKPPYHSIPPPLTPMFGEKTPLKAVAIDLVEVVADICLACCPYIGTSPHPDEARGTGSMSR